MMADLSSAVTDVEGIITTMRMRLAEKDPRLDWAEYQVDAFDVEALSAVLTALQQATAERDAAVQRAEDAGVETTRVHLQLLAAVERAEVAETERRGMGLLLADAKRNFEANLTALKASEATIAVLVGALKTLVEREAMPVEWGKGAIAHYVADTLANLPEAARRLASVDALVHDRKWLTEWIANAVFGVLSISRYQKHTEAAAVVDALIAAIDAAAKGGTE